MARDWDGRCWFCRTPLEDFQDHLLELHGPAGMKMHLCGECVPVVLHDIEARGDELGIPTVVARKFRP